MDCKEKQMVKIARNIYIEKEDWQKLKILAAEKETTVTELIRIQIDKLLIAAGKKKELL